MPRATDLAPLDVMIKRLRGLGDIAKQIASEVAIEFRKELEAQIAAGTSPDDKPWQLTKAGKKPLQKAAKALHVTAIGSSVVARLTGPEALHHLGAARGNVRRQILPTRRLSNKLVAAIARVVDRHVKAVA